MARLTITAESIVRKLGGVWSNNSGRAPCPVHGGEDNNLSVWENEKGYIAVKCHSHECPTDEILKAVGVPIGQSSERNHWRMPSPMAIYQHPDGMERKSYRVQYPDDFEDGSAPCGFVSGGSNQECGRTDPHKHPYGSKGLKASGTYLLKWSGDNPSNTLVIVEGEKAAIMLRRHSFGTPITAVSWFGGSGTWGVTSLKFSESETLEGRKIILWPDADAKGQSSMYNLAKRIKREAKVESIKVVDTSTLDLKGDAADVTAEQAGILLSTAVDFEFDDEHNMAPLLSVAKEEDLGGGDVVAKLRDDKMRQACQNVSHKYINLFEDWYQRIGKAWYAIEEEAVARDVSLECVNICGFALSKPQKALAVDRLKDIVTPPANDIAVLPRERRDMSFNLDSGDTVRGVVFGDAVIEVKDDGDIHRRELNVREFIQSPIRYSLPHTAGDTPLFDAYLESSLSSEDDRVMLMELAGWTLSGRRMHQTIAVLQGMGGSGKGTFLNLLDLLLDGHYRGAGSFDVVSNQFGASKMRGVLAYAFTDVKATPGRGASRDAFMAGATTVKQISGGDQVDVEIKHRADGYSTHLPCAIWVATNFAPRWIEGVEDAEAWRRRICPVVFDRSIPDEEKIDDLAKKMMQEEGPSIALKCLEMFASSIAMGRWPQLTEKGERSLARWLDSAKGEQVMFVEQAVVHTGDEQDRILHRELYNAYEDFSGLSEVTGQSSAGRAVTAAVQEVYGVEPTRVRKGAEVGRGFKGVRFINQEDVDKQQAMDMGGSCETCNETNPALITNGKCEICRMEDE